MIEQEFIMLIMNCKKYSNKALFQKRTWLRTLPSYLKYYHVVGDINLDKNYEYDNEQRILWVKVADDYNSLPKKVIAAYIAVKETFNFKYLFKTDDDQILVKPNFLTILPELIRKKKSHYGGYIVDVQMPYLSQYFKIHPELPQYLPVLKTQYCSGRFYFLSALAILDLISKRENIEKEYLEDYAVGFNLDKQFKKNIFNISSNNFFTDIELSDFPQLVLENKI